jgi:hypothetical protein
VEWVALASRWGPSLTTVSVGGAITPVLGWVGDGWVCMPQLRRPLYLLGSVEKPNRSSSTFTFTFTLSQPVCTSAHHGLRTPLRSPRTPVPPLLPPPSLSGLNASTTYYYRVGGSVGGSLVWSSEFSFKSAPLVGPNVPVNMAVYGDMGAYQRGHSNVPHVVPCCAQASMLGKAHCRVYACGLRVGDAHDVLWLWEARRRALCVLCGMCGYACVCTYMRARRVHVCSCERVPVCQCAHVYVCMCVRPCVYVPGRHRGAPWL